MTFPTVAEQQGDFSNVLDSNGKVVPIYDPSSEATCAAGNGGKPCRTQFSYNGKANVIPPSQMSQVALNMQSFLSKVSGVGTAAQSNYIAPNATGLVNWSTTSRIDYQINSHDTLSVLGAVGRQASSVPVGQSTAGRNVGPVPYNYGQAYAPKTAVWTIEETHIFSPNVINQLKWGYARYNGPTFNPDDNKNFSATTMGLGGLPTGQAQNVFPIVTFAGTDAPTGWNGATENSTIAENYTVLDNLQWNVGKHSFTFGGQVAWLLYNVNNATKGGSTPITLATAVTETAQLNNAFSAVSGTGLAYASFLLGQIDKGSFTQYVQQEFGARFRAISPYIQDNWKVTNKLTLDVGLRYDFFPTVTEIHNAESFFNPNLANTVTGLNGALQYTGGGANGCNCSTPVANYFKNFGPRFGLAYQMDSKTVLRGSYGLMFTHGDAVGGLNTSLGTLGFSAAPSFSASGSLVTTMTNLLAGGNGVIPTYTAASGSASGPTYGTGYTKTSGYTGTPSTGANYDDPYYGGRAPEYINWSFGLQRQLTNKVALTVTYVGSEGHFLQADDNTIRGYWSNGLDPKYLTLGSRLADTGTTATTVTQDCATYNLPCNGLNNFTTSQPLSTLLKPFPFQSVTDNFGQYSANAHYNALQVQLNMRSWHGLTTNINYSLSRAMDDGGYFRTGYAIPAGVINNSGASYKQDAIETGISTSNQPQHFVTTSVWNWPFGKTVFADSNVERAILGGFALSGVFQAFSGSPISVTDSTCSSSNNPAIANTKYCPPTLNPNFTGPARINGKWGKNVTTSNFNSISFIDTNAFTTTPNYSFGNAPRTAAYNLYGPGNYQLDLALVRTFPLHITESTKLNFRAEWYNVTNHTFFAAATTNGFEQWKSSSFGQVTNNPLANRKAAQFSARILF
jgi:hypothetical protein